MKRYRLAIVVFLLFTIMLSYGYGAKAENRLSYRFVVPGGSLTSPFCFRNDPCDLRHAVEEVALSGDIIIVQSGTYTPQEEEGDMIFIDKSLTIFGSCEFNATTPHICHPDERNSILDGDNTNRVIRLEGSGNEVVHIGGFTIQHGIGTVTTTCLGGFDGCGAGIFAYDLERLTLRNNTIRENRAGGDSGIGGGLYALYTDLLEVEDNSFIANRVTETGWGYGGGAFVFGPTESEEIRFNNNIIYGNEISTGTSTNGYGAGVSINDTNNVKILDNVFGYQNITQKPEVNGTSLHLSSIEGYLIEGNTFKNDWGNSVVYIESASLGDIMKNKWWNNQVGYNLELFGKIYGNIVNNFMGMGTLGTLSRGGSSTNIYLHSQESSGSNSISISFNTFAGANFGISVGQYSSVDIVANIFTQLTNSIELATSSVDSSIGYNLFYDNDSDSHQGSAPIFEDPKLVDVANGDFHLLPGSGAIDKIWITIIDEDIDGEKRPIGSGPTPSDAGADEYQTKNYLPLILR
jgi:hypothetical protein